MTSSYRDIIPSIIPTSEIIVEDETHTYLSQERPDGSVFTQERYQLNKAPVVSIEEVRGKLNGSSYTFIEGTDYELDEKEFVDFGIGGESPDKESDFYVTYTTRSIVDRYIEGHEEEIEEVDQKRQKSINSRFVDQATGTELEELGKLFGSLGERRGRDDNEYRIYLKSLVQSFTGRGRKEDLKFAVSSAFGSADTSFRVEENFEELAYTIEIDDWPPHKVFTLVELLELADPSGVELEKISYNVEGDNINVNESVSATISTRLNKDEIGSFDSLVIDPNKFFSSDESASDDGIKKIEPVDKRKHRWEETKKADVTTEWDFFEWTDLEDLIRSTADEIAGDDNTLINDNLIETIDDIGSTDFVIVDKNVTTTTDSSYSDVLVEIDNNLNEIEDVGYSDDDFVIDSNKYIISDVSGISDSASYDDIQNSEFRWQREEEIDNTNVTEWNSFDWNNKDWEKSSVALQRQPVENDSNWGFFVWNELLDLVEESIDSMLSDDNVVVTNNPLITEIPYSSDTVFIDRNENVIIDTTNPSDEVLIDDNEHTVTDISGTSDVSVPTEVPIDEFRWQREEPIEENKNPTEWNSFDWDNSNWEIDSQKRPVEDESNWNFFEWASSLVEIVRENIENMLSGDTVAINKNLLDVTEILDSTDTVFVDRNEHRDANTIGTADVPLVDQNTIEIDSVTDVSEVVDPVVKGNNEHRWSENDHYDETTWGFFEWGEIVSLGVTTTNDSIVSDDANSVDADLTEVAEDIGQTDEVTASTYSVMWGGGDWSDTFMWDIERNPTQESLWGRSNWETMAWEQ